MITLRKDFDFVSHARWRSDGQTLLWTRESVGTTPKEQEKYLSTLPSDKIFLSIHNSTQRHIGTCGLTDIDLKNRTAEFSLLIGQEFQGLGYGTKALRLLCDFGFNTFNLNVIYGETFCYPRDALWLLEDHGVRPVHLSSVYNVDSSSLVNPAANVFKKLGFDFEGYLLKRYYKFSYYVDSLMVSIVRDKWKY